MRNAVKIGIDIDGVLANFNPKYIDLIIKTTGKDLFPPRPFEIKTWSYPSTYGYTFTDEELTWNKILNNDTFWFALPAYDWTAEAIDQLHGRSIRGDFVYFITSRPGVYAKQQTEDWLRTHNSILRPSGWRDYVPTVLITSEKGSAAKLLDLDYYIDDKMENCEDVIGRSPKTQVYIMDQPWNRERISSYKNMIRVDSPLTFLKDI